MLTQIRSFIVIFLIIIHIPCVGQMELWTVGTGKTIPEGHLELSLFRRARYGYTKTFEISAQPWMIVKFPNAQVKKNWYDREISIATVHGLNYPSWALNTIRKRDSEDWIPIDADVPQLFMIKNEVIASKMLKEATTCQPPNYYLSLKAGFQFALSFGDNTLPPLYKPTIFHRTEIYHNKLLWYVGADIDAHLNHFINYCFDIDFLSVRFAIEDWAIEHKGMLMTKLTQSLMVLVGYKLAYGTFDGYPGFGIYPMADISWTYKFKKRKKNQLNLFNNGSPY